jgi:hypothetical protein
MVIKFKLATCEYGNCVVNALGTKCTVLLHLPPDNKTVKAAFLNVQENVWRLEETVETDNLYDPCKLFLRH